MKRILSVFLAVIMCVLPLTANVSAVEVPETAEVVYTFSSAEAFPGETVDVTISIAGTAAGNSYALAKFEYDSDALEFVGFSNFETAISDQMIFPMQPDSAKMAISFPLKAPTELSGKLCTMSFKIKDTANIGTYTVTASNVVAKNGSHDLETFLIPATITVKGQDFTGLSVKDKTVTYDSETHNVEVKGVPEFATVKYYAEDGSEFNGAENAGTYEVSVSVTADGYNEWNNDGEKVTLTINKKEITVNATVADKVYDGTDAITGFSDTPVIEGYVEGDDVSVDEASLATIRFAESKAGTHAIVTDGVVVTGSDKDNYEYTVNVPKATITKRPATITADSHTIKIGEPLPEYTVEVEGVVEGEELVYTVTCAGKNTAVKNYPITVKADAKKNPNYDITVTNGVLYVIDKTEQEVTIAEVDDKTYGDPDFKLEVVEGEGTDEAVEYTAETSNVSVDEEGNVTILGAGEAKITVSKAGDADYADFSETVAFTVNKKNVTVTADNKTATKGDASLPELTYTVDGLVDGDEIEATLTTAAKNANTVKDYPITVKVTVKNYPNYNITLVNGVLSVIDKTNQEITVTSNLPSDLTYGDEGFKIDVAYGEIVSENETVFVSSDEDVVKVDAEGNVTVVGAGEATITVSKAGDEDLADFSEEIEVKVAKKPITITANDNGKKIGNADPKLSYSVTGTLVGDDTFFGNVERIAGEEVGTYIIGPGTLGLTNSDNYDVTFIRGTFTIFDKTPQNITLTQSYSKTYGDEAFDLDVAYGTENVSSEATTFVSDNEAVATVDATGKVTIVGVGTAKITVAKKGDEDLADFSKNVTVSVVKREIKVTADAKEKYVDQETPELTYTVEGELVGDDAFSGELTVADGNKAGKNYDIKIGSLTLGDNYKIVYTGAKLSVLAKVEQQITLGDVSDVVYGQTTSIDLEVTKIDCNTDAAVVFTSGNPEVATVDENGKITIIGAGDVDIEVTVEGNYKYYPFSDIIGIYVEKADLDFVVVPGQQKKFGTEDPELKYEIVGTLYGDTVVVGALEREPGEEIGNYDIKKGTLTLSDPENYSIGYVFDTFEIVEKNTQTVTVSGVPESFKYGDTFTVTAVSEELPEASVSFACEDTDVAVVDESGNVTIVGAGMATVVVTVAGNDEYADFVYNVSFIAYAVDINVVSIDLVEKTVEFDAVFEEDADAVSIDFNKLTFVPEEVAEGETPENYVVTGLVLTGEKAVNYVLTTESVLVPVSEEIELATVSATAENGTVEGVGSYLAGSEITLNATADKNYKFAGWYVGEEKISSEAEYTFTADSDIEITAKFTKKSTGGGGSGTSTPTRVVYFRIAEDNIDAVSVNKGSKVARPEDPELEGFKFEGWFTDAEFTAEFDFDTEINDSVTVYAKWTEIEKEPEGGEDKPGEGEDKPGEGEDDGKTDEPAEWENPYDDVDENDWFYETVKDASANGIMNGMSEKNFKPYEQLTRAMLVTILYRANGEAEVDGDVTFEDVDLDAYYGDALIWATENGIVNGYSETKFAPNDKITREQIAAIIFRYATYKGLEAIDLSENLGFKDSDDISEYAVSSMNWAVGQGIITGYENNTIKPQNNATRAEAATIVIRFLAKLG